MNTCFPIYACVIRLDIEQLLSTPHHLQKYEQVIKYWSIIFQQSACTIAGAWTQSYSVLELYRTWLPACLSSSNNAMIIARCPTGLIADSATGQARFEDCMWVNFSSYRSRTLLGNYSTWTRLSLSTAVTEGMVLAEETMTWSQAFRKGSLSICWGWWARGWTVNNISWGYELTLLVKLPRTPARGDHKSR